MICLLAVKKRISECQVVEVRLDLQSQLQFCWVKLVFSPGVVSSKHCLVIYYIPLSVEGSRISRGFQLWNGSFWDKCSSGGNDRLIVELKSKVSWREMNEVYKLNGLACYVYVTFFSNWIRYGRLIFTKWLVGMEKDLNFNNSETKKVSREFQYTVHSVVLHFLTLSISSWGKEK